MGRVFLKSAQSTSALVTLAALELHSKVAILQLGAKARTREFANNSTELAQRGAQLSQQQAGQWVAEQLKSKWPVQHTSPPSHQEAARSSLRSNNKIKCNAELGLELGVKEKLLYARSGVQRRL